ncbi:sensor domain-containing protein [Gimibacter soli]|uniref:Bifunctional diguanylate cyclase/phosphodiesterase n=1 Tax=Gimibacter soli TaxID=3024400 RepID=A0AAF0BKB2_9PROT|nr:bifunctional diguanylate cyclase/phosphodiesterase [Gimibacter soli]WCL52757.1 bifunctional diguanylate cyclase/phosphodiesterase [Gimibacter soli]
MESKIAPIASHAEGGSFVSRIVNTSAVVERLPVGVLVCGLTPGKAIEILFINKFARDIFTTDTNLVAPCPIEALWGSGENYILSGQVQETFRSQRRSNFEWSVRHGAVERYLSSQLIPLKDHTGMVYQVICTVEDQTAEKLAERNLLHHAFHDALTGLPNRVLFRNKLEEAVSRPMGDDKEIGCAVLIVNIDRFQQINDSFGHSAGDRFLVAMAATLRRCIRSTDTLARFSGDEFAILVGKCRDLEEVNLVSGRIHEAMELPYDLDGNEVFTSVSIGVATTLSSSTHPEDLIRDADFAMHRAKAAGKARTEIYQRDSHQRVRSQFHLETELRRAVERDDLELYYQPIVDLKTSQIHGFEALTRWHHKERGFVSPAEFIPLAEETGVIVALGRWATRTACAQIRTWMDAYGTEKVMPINVNVSGIQFARDDVAAMVEASLEEYQVPGEWLRIELTESAIMANPVRISESLSRLRRLGVKVALDDFGTGYSSLNYIHQFPIDVIKIDRSFINQLQFDNEPYKILSMIGLLAKSLGLEVVAEGLEDIDHIQMLADLDFNFAQGFYFSKPMPASDVGNLISGRLPWLK